MEHHHVPEELLKTGIVVLKPLCWLMALLMTFYIWKKGVFENGYFFIDNSNIEIRDLWKDGIHLLESGKTKFAENFIYFLKNSYWFPPHNYFLEAHTHGIIEHTYSQLLNTKTFEAISAKSILNTNTSNEANSENNVLKTLRLKNSNKVITSHINININ